MDEILDVMDDIKQNITDNQYIIIMNSLKKIYKKEETKSLIENNSNLIKLIPLLYWLEHNLKLTELKEDTIKRNFLYYDIITNVFNNNYEMLDSVKLILKIFFINHHQIDNVYFTNVIYRQDDWE